MKAGHIILVIVLALLAGYAGARLSPAPQTQVAAHSDQPAFDRVMKTGTIRCGYAMWPPAAIYKDPATGELSGAFVEIMNEAASNMNLKVEWVEETGWGSFIEGLETNRFDVFCAPLWRNAERGLRVGYTVPLAYSALHFYTRADDTRFDDDLDVLNDGQYKLSVMDGEMSHIVARKFFPAAQQVSIPQMGDVSQLFLNVSTGKADGVFSETSLAKDFSDKNPGQIRQVTKEPYNVYPDSFGVRLGEVKLQQALDSALLEILNQGEMDRIIGRFDPDRSIFMPVARPYEFIAPPPLK